MLRIEKSPPRVWTHLWIKPDTHLDSNSSRKGHEVWKGSQINQWTLLLLWCACIMSEHAKNLVFHKESSKWHLCKSVTSSVFVSFAHPFLPFPPGLSEHLLPWMEGLGLGSSWGLETSLGRGLVGLWSTSHTTFAFQLDCVFTPPLSACCISLLKAQLGEKKSWNLNFSFPCFMDNSEITAQLWCNSCSPSSPFALFHMAWPPVCSFGG